MPKSAEKNKEIRDQSKEMILRKALPYFAKHGLNGTKIGDLAKHIGIGQGSMYAYFDSKEALYQEIQKSISKSLDKDIKNLKMLAALPISAAKKIRGLTDFVLQRLREEENAAAMVVISTQMMLEENAGNPSMHSAYPSGLYENTAKIIEQAQKEGSAALGNPMKLADYYWGVIYLYALKKLFTADYALLQEYDLLSSADLERTILKYQEDAL